MAAACKKCDPHEICEECPEWIFTLADLIMCMMGLFVILWVLKPGPKPEEAGKLDPETLKVVAAIREAFGHIPDPQSKDPVDMYMLMKKIEQLETPLRNPGKGGETKERKEGVEGTDPLVTKIRPGSHVGTGGRMLFERGSAELPAQTSKELDEVVRLIRGHRQIFMVKGHASLDDFPPDGADHARDQMDLSLRRAQAAAEYLAKHGVSHDIIRVQGCSTFEPVVQRIYDPDAQRSNRRVEVEASDQVVAERQDPNAAVRAKPIEPTARPVTAHLLGHAD